MFMLSSQRHINLLCTFSLNFVSIVEVYSKLCQVSKLEYLAKTVNSLFVFVKSSILKVTSVTKLFMQ